MRRRVVPLLASGAMAAGVCAVVAAAVAIGALERLELQLYDALVWLGGFPPPRAELVVVDFDESTMEALDTFPIPWARLAEVVERIASGGPEVIGLDFLLSEGRCGEGPERLAEALGRAGNVILVSSLEAAQLAASEPLPVFREQALDVAFGNLRKDADGTIRRMLLYVRTGDYQGVSFPVALASNYLRQPLRPGGSRAFRLGPAVMALDGTAPNSALISYWTPKVAEVVPARRLLEPGFDPGAFTGKVVLVGQSSSYGKDLFETPLSSFRGADGVRTLVPGVEIQAAAVASLLSGRTVAVARPSTRWLLNFAAAWLVMLVVRYLRPGRAVPAVLAAMLALLVATHLLFSIQGLWLRSVSTHLAMFLALPAALGQRFLQERRMKIQAEAERTALMGLFERYVSPEVARVIWDRRDEIVLGGQERTATVLFSDIRGFTAQSAGRPSREILAWLNDYFTAMSEVVKRNGGFLNKFIGDGMMVVFGVPLSDRVAADARRAVRTALEMLHRVRELEELGLGPAGHRSALRIGIGIHTGPLTAGNVGARDRLEYSVIGETVNLASRLEGLTKQFQVPIVISPQTEKLVRDAFETRSLGRTTVRGLEGEIVLYTIVGERPEGRTA